MTFVSYEFLILMAIVLVLNAVLPSRVRSWMLLVASYIFYGWWDWRFLGLLAFSSVVDFVAALKIANAQQTNNEKTALSWLRVSLITNLGLLGAFKYFGFFVESLQAALLTIGIDWQPGLAKILLPVGISFYTFQTMSYTIDVYRRELKATQRLDDFLLYVSFFPQLVAGPIERAQHLLPQMEAMPRPRAADFTSGLELVFVGFYFKMVVADNLAPFVNTVFHSNSAGGALVAAASVAFAFQIYGDFAGYSLIARGTARMLGFDIRANFTVPYVSRSPSEFWQRWHISLSSWLRDYLYIPLGGNRGSELKTYRNLALTMLLGGLWHGASWTFVLWGAFHGLLLIGYRLFGDRSHLTRPDAPTPFWRRLLGGTLFFVFTCFGWLIFRADNLTQLTAFSKALFFDWRPEEVSLSALLRLSVFVIPILLLDTIRVRSKNLEPWLAWPRPIRALMVLAIFYAIVLFGTPYAVEFIYFQF